MTWKIVASVVFTQLDWVFNFENFRDKISIFLGKNDKFLKICGLKTG